MNGLVLSLTRVEKLDSFEEEGKVGADEQTRNAIAWFQAFKGDCHAGLVRINSVLTRIWSSNSANIG